MPETLTRGATDEILLGRVGGAEATFAQAESADDASSVDLDKWFKLYSSRIFSLLLRNTGGSYHLAEDLTQDTFLGAAKSLSRGNYYDMKGEYPYKWLVTIALNVSRHHFKMMNSLKRGKGIKVHQYCQDPD
ncbi:MAG: sigma-70 family RNA polymerase sigma factor, partial [Chloroflexi bacterium]|nr:sigma-70 family RNA polymerase sigma factor [Chloroflexota bacterium]